MHRWSVAAAATLIIVLGASASALAKHAAHRTHNVTEVMPSLDIYSRRALRRAKTILQLRLLELRKAHLDRARQVIEGRLPVDSLFCGELSPKRPPL